MTYEIFKTTVLETIKDFFGEGVTVTINKVVKNNNLILDGLVIQDKRSNIAPTIYLNHYYKSFIEGSSEINEIINDILRTYEEHECTNSFDASAFTDIGKARDKIVYKLINTERNKDLLNNIPSIPFLDLSIVFYYLLDSTVSGEATILIKNEHLSYWGLDANELYEIAVENTPRLLPAKLSSMFDVLSSIIFDSNADPDVFDYINDDIPMYVVTNTNGLNGAISVLYDGLLKGFSDKLGKDLYLLPSSISEMIILPADECTDPEMLKEMVVSVNSTELAPTDILSDSVYRYTRENDSITQC